MSIKYILHGGGAQHVNSDNDTFFAEIIKDATGEVKILLVEFAGGTEKTALNAKVDMSQFERVRGGKNLTFDVAEEHSFLKQIKKADIVYVGGGTTVRLLEVLAKFPNLGEYFSGKIVAGESAGANCLSTYCYSKSGGGVVHGLGLVPVKMIPHYDGEYKEELEALPEKLDMLLLSNYQYKVFII